MPEKIAVRLVPKVGHCIKLEMELPLKDFIQTTCRFTLHPTFYVKRLAVINGGEKLDVREVIYCETREIPPAIRTHKIQLW